MVSEKPFKKSLLVPGHHGIYRYKRNHLSTRQRLLKKSNELLEASFAKMSSLQVFMAKSKLTEALRTGGIITGVKSVHVWKLILLIHEWLKVRFYKQVLLGVYIR